ncbi:hypothetical protein CCACVL1_02980 [Corchorus capsularis]|uniref:Uncharacterized protein n=1 Tax=Corchorus capsularis TaxID=210143 RepID=A0A1R3K4B5_COCAP|nr:hypothetical protein CCACVL1_02980 [Corchorus capsularis]
MANSSQPFGERGTKAKPIYEVLANSHIAVLEDKVDATNAQVAKLVNLITTKMESKACGLCSLEDHPTDMCPTLYEEEVNEVNAIGNAPYVNPYNSWWRPNPLRYGNTTQSRPNPFPQGQQNFQPKQILSRPQGLPHKHRTAKSKRQGKEASSMMWHNQFEKVKRGIIARFPNANTEGLHCRKEIFVAVEWRLWWRDIGDEKKEEKEEDSVKKKSTGAKRRRISKTQPFKVSSCWLEDSFGNASEVVCVSPRSIMEASITQLIEVGTPSCLADKGDSKKECLYIDLKEYKN